MAHKVDRLQLIRERHRKLILEPRKKMESDGVPEWDDEGGYDLSEDEIVLQGYFDKGDDDA